MTLVPRLASVAEYHSLGVITWRERQALELRFERRLSLSVSASSLGITRSAVRDRTRSGLRKIAAFEEAKAA